MEPLLQGRLRKRGHIMPTWRFRTFVLQFDFMRGFVLDYFVNEADRSAGLPVRGSINITKDTRVGAVSAIANGFVVASEGQPEYWLAAASDSERRRWMSVIEKVRQASMAGDGAGADGLAEAAAAIVLSPVGRSVSGRSSKASVTVRVLRADGLLTSDHSAPFVCVACGTHIARTRVGSGPRSDRGPTAPEFNETITLPFSRSNLFAVVDVGDEDKGGRVLGRSTLPLLGVGPTPARFSLPLAQVVGGSGSATAAGLRPGARCVGRVLVEVSTSVPPDDQWPTAFAAVRTLRPFFQPLLPPSTRATGPSLPGADTLDEPLHPVAARQVRGARDRAAGPSSPCAGSPADGVIADWPPAASERVEAAAQVLLRPFADARAGLFPGTLFLTNYRLVWVAATHFVPDEDEDEDEGLQASLSPAGRGAGGGGTAESDPGSPLAGGATGSPSPRAEEPAAIAETGRHDAPLWGGPGRREAVRVVVDQSIGQAGSPCVLSFAIPLRSLRSVTARNAHVPKAADAPLPPLRALYKSIAQGIAAIGEDGTAARTPRKLRAGSLSDEDSDGVSTPQRVRRIGDEDTEGGGQAGRPTSARAGAGGERSGGGFFGSFRWPRRAESHDAQEDGDLTELPSLPAAGPDGPRRTGVRVPRSFSSDAGDDDDEYDDEHDPEVHALEGSFSDRQLVPGGAAIVSDWALAPHASPRQPAAPVSRPGHGRRASVLTQLRGVFAARHRPEAGGSAAPPPYADAATPPPSPSRTAPGAESASRAAMAARVLIASAAPVLDELGGGLSDDEGSDAGTAFAAPAPPPRLPTAPPRRPGDTGEANVAAAESGATTPPGVPAVLEGPDAERQRSATTSWREPDELTRPGRSMTLAAAPPPPDERASLKGAAIAVTAAVGGRRRRGRMSVALTPAMLALGASAAAPQRRQAPPHAAEAGRGVPDGVGAADTAAADLGVVTELDDDGDGESVAGASSGSIRSGGAQPRRPRSATRSVVDDEALLGSLAAGSTASFREAELPVLGIVTSDARAPRFIILGAGVLPEHAALDATPSSADSSPAAVVCELLRTRLLYQIIASRAAETAFVDQAASAIATTKAAQRGADPAAASWARDAVTAMGNGWRWLDAGAVGDFRRQGVPASFWRVCRLNDGFSFSPSYPRAFVVPARADDVTVRASGAFRSRARVPALTWYHPANGATICRCSQPLTGAMGQRSDGDAAMLESIRLASPCPADQLAILDCRPVLSAKANMLKGGGFEAAGYPGCSVFFCNIGNIHAVRKSYEALVQACRRPSAAIVPSIKALQDRHFQRDAARTVSRHMREQQLAARRAERDTDDDDDDDDGAEGASPGAEDADFPAAASASAWTADMADGVARATSLGSPTSLASVLDDVGRRTAFMKEVSESSWLSHASNILAAAVRCVRLVDALGVSVLVHCSDGWDRTAQVASLAKLLMDPFYRTIDGFLVLVQTDWVGFGHKFSERMGRLHPDSEETSPVFLQWLDCVFQVCRQFPDRFEFRPELLEEILVLAQAGWGGAFLFDNDAERAAAGLPVTSVPEWMVLRASGGRLRNPAYSTPPPECLRPVLGRGSEPVRRWMRSLVLIPDFSEQALRIWPFFQRFDRAVYSAVESTQGAAVPTLSMIDPESGGMLV